MCRVGRLKPKQDEDMAFMSANQSHGVFKALIYIKAVAFGLAISKWRDLIKA